MSDAPSRDPRGHVLIVDDHAALADNLRELLDESPGELEITVLGSGRKALEVAKKRGFDVAIVDVQLPDGSGVDWLPALRAAAPLGEVVLITGYATIDAAIAALRAGAYAFVLKSFRPEELRTTVHQALTKVALRRERDQLERRYRALVQAADVVVVALDRDGRAQLLNPKFTALTGLAPTAVAQAPLWESCVVAADRERFRDAVANVAATGHPREIEASLVAIDGSHRMLRWHFSGEAEGVDATTGVRSEPPANDRSDPEAQPHVPRPNDSLVFGIGVDVTERRELERRAATAEALSTMGTLALGLAHEVRNPLNAAVLQMHLLGRQVEREVPNTEPRRSMSERVQIVVGEIKRLSRLLTEFLELARPRGLSREPVDLGELVSSVVDLHREEAASREVSLRVGSELAPAHASARCVVAGDREKLKQVFVNLLVNALEATPRGGRVRFEAQKQHGRVRVEISDDGPGIAEADRARVFDPFFTTKPGGTGLGLSIVRKILDQHEGSIDVRSAAGEGTTVVVELPAA